ncbi:hypothetical protein FisN_3Hh031 [Fistulifera solaris]|jgi:hypothetical protein|uniref:Selenoprotein F/M domain-containing protein n=1 Tax=Fistulifera solaris TaxID=1519565 RepID=A0A1Z5JNJ7_FISSO|nr:hypothetical protein FisN_3Hh031 [Fistulifera solaris]|eukprot:GAX15564.1 hypothetical protein FisN_3Hh031 [Fistulifera solaris]
MICVRHWIFLALFASANCAEAASRWGFRKQYTPLLFFTVPKGLIPECDAMERAVRALERDTGIRVERLDLLRQPETEAILGLLTQKTPPFLYHRESGQSLHVPTGGKAIDIIRLRAWAKGRMLSTPSGVRGSVSGICSRAPAAARQQQEREEKEDMIENMSLTPTQLEGKQKMKERTRESNNKKT